MNIQKFWQSRLIFFASLAVVLAGCSLHSHDPVLADAVDAVDATSAAEVSLFSTVVTEFKTESSHDLWIATDSRVNTYVAFPDQSHGSRLSVVKSIDGANMSYLGNPGFAHVHPNYIDIATDPLDHSPYVVYSDEAADYKIIVKAHIGNWRTIGSGHFSDVPVLFPKIRFDSDGVVYVAYVEHSTYNIIVKRLSGSQWVKIDEKQLYYGAIADFEFELTSKGQPIIMAVAEDNNYQIEFAVYEGYWDHYPSPGNSTDVSLALDANDIVHIGYRDHLSGKNIVRKYNNNWQNVGVELPSSTGVGPNIIFTEPSGTLIAYTDQDELGVSSAVVVHRYANNVWSEVVALDGYFHARPAVYGNYDFVTTIGTLSRTDHRLRMLTTYVPK